MKPIDFRIEKDSMGEVLGDIEQFPGSTVGSNRQLHFIW
jgi:hypothetical protein